MSVAVNDHVLIGRDGERRELTDLTARVCGGTSAVLVVCGEPGIGKTTLLEHALRPATGLTVLRLTGSDAEVELAYSGVQQLAAPLLSFVTRLPPVQANALRVAIGIDVGPPPDALLVALALLTLLVEAAGQQPVLCFVDDAQWIDAASMSALLVVARRIAADPVGIVFALREAASVPGLSEMPTLEVGRLDEHASRALLDTVLPGPLDPDVRENVLAEAAGNPLALREIHQSLTPGEMAGGFGLATHSQPSARIERTYGRRLQALAADSKTLLLLAACDPLGRAEWLRSAARSLDLPTDEVQPAGVADLMSVDDRVRFRHPLIRATVYRNATSAERRRAHAALANVIADAEFPEYRAWHRAKSVDGPDEAVAGELDQSATRARGRGGLAAAAAFLELASRLTPDPERRAERAIAAAEAKLDAGALDDAAELLDLAHAASGTTMVNARIEMTRARIAFASRRGADAPPLLLNAAKRLASLDPVRARETYLDALSAAVLTGSVMTGAHNAVTLAATAAMDAPKAAETRTADLLLHGLTVRLTDGYTRAAPLLRRAIDQLTSEDDDATSDTRWHEIAHRICLDLFDQDSYGRIVDRHLADLRRAGALSALPIALITSAGLRVTSGQFGGAEMLLGEADALVNATTGAGLPVTSMHCYLAAYRGEEARCRELVAAKLETASTLGQGFEAALVSYAAAILHNGLGQYRDALAAAMSGVQSNDLGISGYLLVELIEASARLGDRATAAGACRRLVERTDASPTITAQGLAARSIALTASGATADEWYQQALDLLRTSPAVMYLPRTQLIYGEWLRRARRLSEARVQLTRAHATFTAMGAQGFGQRAERELRAGGGPVDATIHRGPKDLTAQEAQIVALVRSGHTNTEIASQLFVSPRTVEWHLGHVYTKLGITSRRELRAESLPS